MISFVTSGVLLINFVFIFVVSLFLIRAIWDKSGMIHEKKVLIVWVMSLLIAIFGALHYTEEPNIFDLVVSSWVKSFILIFWAYLMMRPKASEQTKRYAVKVLLTAFSLSASYQLYQVFGV